MVFCLRESEDAGCRSQGKDDPHLGKHHIRASVYIIAPLKCENPSSVHVA